MNHLCHVLSDLSAVYSLSASYIRLHVKTLSWYQEDNDWSDYFFIYMHGVPGHDHAAKIITAMNGT